MDESGASTRAEEQVDSHLVPQTASSSKSPTQYSSTSPAKASSHPEDRTAGSFAFPLYYSFPPFFTLQPVASTRASQMATWSDFILKYCRHYRIFRLVISDAVQTDLFFNKVSRKQLSIPDAVSVLDWMAGPDGGRRAEWVEGEEAKTNENTSATTSAAVTGEKEMSNPSAAAAKVVKTRCWIYWRRPEEWATLLEEWVSQTGQKGSVLTVYEIAYGEAGKASATGREFQGMDINILLKALRVLVKKGRAQIFGGTGGTVRSDEWERLGVKFF